MAVGGCADRHPHTEQRRAVLLPTGEQVPQHCLLSGKKKGGKKPQQINSVHMKYDLNFN